VKDLQGKFHSFRKSSLKELRRLKEESPMPSYERLLDAAELDDLVAYLASLRGKS
jgi:cytochrome c553